MSKNPILGKFFDSKQTAPPLPIPFQFLKEDKKELDEKLNKILVKQSNKRKREEKQTLDDIESDPLFGNTNIFAGSSTENGKNSQEKAEEIAAFNEVFRLFCKEK